MVVAFYSRAPYTGKDTATQFAVDWLSRYGLTAKRVSFADKMKIVCADALGLPRDWTDEQKIAEIDKLKLDPEGFVHYSRREDHHDPGSPRATSTGTQGRDFIIGLAGDTSGTFGIRRFDPTFWIRHALSDVPAEVAVISDLRYLPEGEYVHGHGGKIIEIVRPGQQHKNEDDLPDDWVSAVIHNSGTLAQLCTSVDSALDRLVT